MKGEYLEFGACLKTAVEPMREATELLVSHLFLVELVEPGGAPGLIFWDLLQRDSPAKKESQMSQIQK